MALALLSTAEDLTHKDLTPMSEVSLLDSLPRVKQPGVYVITCTVNGRVYVGSTRNLRKRWQDHRTRLTLGTHPNPQLQADYAAHGPDAFTYAILDDCALPLLDQQERYWIRHLGANISGYNIRLSYGLTRQGRGTEPPAEPRGAWLRVFDR